MPTAANPSAAREPFLAAPIIAMTLIVLLLGVLLWVLHIRDVETQREALIKDILWAEQTLHFHLTSNEEKLQQLAAGLGQVTAEPGLQRRQIEQILNNNPEIKRIVWLDAARRPSATMPPVATGGDPEIELDADAFALARSLGRPRYTSARLRAPDNAAFAVYVPVFRDGQFAGALAATYSIDALLTHDVPWWFTQKYNLSIVDGAGTLLGSKSHVPLADQGPSYQVPFDPPDHELSLVATAYGLETNLGRNAVAAAIFILALSSLWSLWALRSHARRRLASEAALRAEHAFRRAMEDSLTVGLRARDLEGRVVFVNRAFCRMVGWSAEDLVGCRPPMPYWIPEEAEQMMALHRSVMSGNAPPEGFELRLRRRSGEPFDALIHEAPLIDAAGRHTGWMGSVLDITERKRAEALAREHQEKLQHTGRLIAMGEMASTLAHELNQPLAAIASYSAGCLNRLTAGQGDPEELTHALHKLRAQAQRAGQIIRRVHDFVRKQEPVLAPCAIGDVVSDSVDFITADARHHGVTMSVDTLDPTLVVQIDRVLIEQVMLNLMRNAIEAMAGTESATRRLDLSVRRMNGAIAVSVADRGTGIAPEIAGQIFTPFFTTKAEGMGMGLNICRSIVEFHGGRLWHEANPGGGALFHFTLPPIEP